MAVPKRKMSRSATRSRKSANMQLALPAALVVPELRGVALPHTVCGTVAGTEAARSSTSTDSERDGR